MGPKSAIRFSPEGENANCNEIKCEIIGIALSKLA